MVGGPPPPPIPMGYKGIIYHIGEGGVSIVNGGQPNEN